MFEIDMLVDFFVLPVVESPVDIVDQVFGCDGFDIFCDFPRPDGERFQGRDRYAGIRLIGSIEKRKKFSYRCT